MFHFETVLNNAESYVISVLQKFCYKYVFQWAWILKRFYCSILHYIVKSIGSPLLMNGLTTLVISISTNLNVKAYNDIGNCVLLIL